MPISLEQWRAAVGRWVARIQRALIIRRGVKRSPPCASNQEWESSLGQSHSGERKCMWKRKGRKKHKDDPVNDPAIASDEFYDGVIVLAATLFCFGMTMSKDCSDRNPAGSLKELFSWTGLGAFLVIMLLLLRSGDVELHPGPAEKGAHTLLSISSTPTLHEVNKLTVCHAASQWEEVAPHFVVETCGGCKFGSGHLQEASRVALSRHRKDKSDIDIVEKTRCSVLEAQEANGNIPLAEQRILFEESCEEPVIGLAFPPGVFGAGRRQQYMLPPTTAAPHVRRHSPGDLEHGTHTLLSISSMSTLHELGKLTVDHAASQWEVVAPHLVVESFGICKFGCDHLQEGSRGALSRWLKDESDTDIAEKTRCSVLEAQEASRNISLAEQLKLFEDSFDEPVTGLASPPGSDHTLFGDNEIHGPDGKLAQQDPIRPSCHLSCDLLNELLHFDLIVDCLSCHFGQWMKAAPTRSDLSCPLSNEVTLCSLVICTHHTLSNIRVFLYSYYSNYVPVTPLSPDKSAHLLSVKSNTVINALTRRTAALITFLLWQMRLVALAFLLLFLLEVTAANLDKARAWRNAGNGDTSSHCEKMCAFQSNCVQCSLNLHMIVRTKYMYRAASQLLCGMRTKPYVFLRELLLLAGDVEPNPGPLQAEEVLLFFRNRFISEVDANAIVMKLLHKGIIHEGDRKEVSNVSNPIEQNEILHLCLKKKCTNDALKTVCDAMIGVVGNPKMATLGADMKKRLEGVIEAASGVPGGSLTLASSENSKEFQKFSRKMQTHYARMKVVDDRWRKSQSMEYVKLALSRFKLDFENELKKFVEAISHPEGVDKVYTVVKNAKIEYKDIPTMVKQRKLVIISGAPGVGKSTLAKKLCQDISNKISDHKYDLVLLVELRDLIAFKGLGEQFKLHHLLQLFTESTQVAVHLATEFQAHDGKGILLILDGYDELLQELREAPFFTDLLAHTPKSPLHECDIVLTSRSILTSQIYHHLTKASTGGDVTNIEVLGFTKAQIKRYAQLYFDAEGMQPLCPQFQAKLESVPQIYSLCSIPVVLSIICRVFLAKKDLPSTLTEAYNDFVFEKVLLNSPDIDVDSLLHLPPTHDFYQLSEIAFSCFVDQKVIFTSEELKDLSARYSNRETGCGLLTARPVDKLRCILAAVDSFFFIHQTVQEFLSALHICRQEVVVQKEIWAKYLGQPHMAQVWKFFSGLSKLDNFDVLEVAPKLDDEEVLVQSLYESQNEAVVAQVVPAYFGPDPKVKLVSVHSSIAHGYCLQQFRNMNSLEVVGRLNTNVQISRFLQPVLSALKGAVLQHLAIRKLRPKDWHEVAEVLKTLWCNSPQIDDDHSADEAHLPIGELHFEDINGVSLDLVVLDLILCKRTNVKIEVSHPTQTLSPDLLSEMAAALGQNKTMRSLVLNGPSGTPFELGHTQHSALKQFVKYLLLGVSRNSTLEEVHLQLPCLSGFIKRDDTEQHLKNIMLERVTLDVVCDVVNFEHMKELQCMGISDPQESLSLDLLRKMSTSLTQNKTMVKLKLVSGVYSPEDGKLFIRHLLLGLSGNNTLTDLTLDPHSSWWDWPERNLVQRSVETVSLNWIPPHFVCEAVEFFEHVKELECANIREPQQSEVTEDDLKLEELEGTLAGHESLKKLRFQFFYEEVPQALVQKFGVAAVRGVGRNKSIAGFQLQPCKSGPQVVNGMLAQLTAVERMKFRAVIKAGYYPSIELCALGEPSSGGAPSSTDSQPISEDTVMDLDRTEGLSVVRETSCHSPTEPAVGGDGGAVDSPTQGSQSTEDWDLLEPQINESGPSGSDSLAHSRLCQPHLPQMLPHQTQRLLLPSLQHSQQQPPAAHPLARPTHPPPQWSRRAPPPSPQPYAVRHMSPHPWRTVGYPPQSVGQYQIHPPLGWPPFHSEQSFGPRHFSTCPWPSTEGYRQPIMGQYQAPHPLESLSLPPTQSLTQRVMFPSQFPMGYDSYSVEQRQGAQHVVSGDFPGPSGITIAPRPPVPPTFTETPLPLPPQHSAQAPSRKRPASPLPSEPRSSKKGRRGAGGGRR